MKIEQRVFLISIFVFLLPMPPNPAQGTSAALATAHAEAEHALRSEVRRLGRALEVSIGEAEALRAANTDLRSQVITYEVEAMDRELTAVASPSPPEARLGRRRVCVCACDFSHIA